MKCDYCDKPIPEGHQYIETQINDVINKYHLLCYNHVIKERKNTLIISRR